MSKELGLNDDKIGFTAASYKEEIKLESHKAGDEPDDDKSKANDGPGEVSDKAAANDPQVRPLLEDGNYSKDLELTHKLNNVELGKVEVKSSLDLSKKETAVENLSALDFDTSSNSAIHYLEDVVGTITISSNSTSYQLQC